MALVRLPVNPVPSKDDEGVDANRQRILYVEDEDDNFVVAQFALRDRFELVRAKTDREACDILRDESFELILMDIQLSGSELNGIELTQVLKGLRKESIPEYARDLDIQGARIIIVTAYAAHYSDEDVSLAGGDEFVTKPVDFIRLSLSISRLLVREAFEDRKEAGHALRRQNMEEKRQAVRVRMRLDCYMRIKGQEHAAQIWDVSAAGARVRFVGNIPAQYVVSGTVCQINFSTAWGFIESEARVMWVKEDKSLEVGIAFENMNDEAQKILARELAGPGGKAPGK